MKKTIFLFAFITCALPSTILYSMQDESYARNRIATQLNLEHEGKLPNAVYLEGRTQSFKLPLDGTGENRLNALKKALSMNRDTREITFEYEHLYTQYVFAQGNKEPYIRYK